MFGNEDMCQLKWEYDPDFKATKDVFEAASSTYFMHRKEAVIFAEALKRDTEAIRCVLCNMNHDEMEVLFERVLAKDGA